MRCPRLAPSAGFGVGVLGLFLIACVIQAEEPGGHSHPDGGEGTWGLSNCVRALYHDILGREPDPEGLRFYVGKMSEGRDQAWVRACLEGSRERAHQRREALERRRRFVAAACVGVAVGLTAGLACHRPRTSLAVAWALSLGAVATYFSLLWTHALNVPSWDEFDLVLRYFLWPFPERWKHILDLHNEHRMLGLRLLMEIPWLLAGHVNLKVMKLATNLPLIGVLALWASEWRRRGLPVTHWPAVPLLLMLPIPLTNLSQVTPFNTVIFLVSLAIWLGMRAGPAALTGALAAASLASATMAPGLLSFGVLILLTGLQRRSLSSDLAEGRKRPGVRLLWSMLAMGGVGLAVWLLYFRGYSRPAHHPPLGACLDRPLESVGYGLAFAGSALRNPLPASVAGVGLIGFWAWATREGMARRVPFSYGMLTFVLLVSGSAVLARSGMGWGQALSDRYAVFSLCGATSAVVMLWVLAPRLLKRRWLLALAMGALTACFVWTAMAAGPRLRDENKIVLRETGRWLETGYGLHYPHANREHAAAVLRECIRRGVYHVPLELFE